MATDISYIGDGSSVLYSFPFEYLDEADINVSFDSVVTTAYTFANATQIQLDAAPAPGTVIRIYRVTNVGTLKNTFYPGSAIRASDLNTNFQQTIFTTQEVVERFIDNTSAVFNGNVDLNGYRITNLVEGVADSDAVTKAQLDASQTYNDSQLVDAVDDITALVTSAQTQATNSAISAAAAADSVADAEELTATAAFWGTAANVSAVNAANSASAAASFAGSTVFFGFRRTATSNLVLDYSSTAETDTYATRDYEVKGGSQWYIGSNDVLHQSGPNLGEPRFAFNADGHLILSDT